MTKEQYNTLQPFEQQFSRAINSSFVRNLLPAHKQILSAVYKELFKTDGRLYSSCSHCVLEDMKKLGKEYFKYKDALEQTQQATEELQEQIVIVKEVKKTTSKTNNSKSSKTNNKTKKK